VDLQAVDLSWPLGMVDECDMDVDIDIAAEVTVGLFFVIQDTV